MSITILGIVKPLWLTTVVETVDAMVKTAHGALGEAKKSAKKNRQ